jgi:hypothetical protein
LRLAGGVRVDRRAWPDLSGRAREGSGLAISRLAAAGEPHAGIVYAPQHTSVSALIHGLLLIHRLLDAEEMAGHIEFL